MGLRDYEFDVSPELLAALSRGRPGPLMDVAMRHAGDVVQSARDAAQREQNERDRRTIDAAEASIAASLEEVSTNVGNGVNRGGAFGVGRVGGSIPGVNRMGSDLADPTSGVGPGGGVGWITGPKGIRIRGVTVQDFIQGQILGRGAHASLTPQGAVLDDSPLTTEEQERVRDKREIDSLGAQLPQAYLDLKAAMELYEEGYYGGASDAELDGHMLRRTVIEGFIQHQNAEITRRIIDLNRPRRDSEDSLTTSNTLDTFVDAFSLWQRLKSLGGLGFSERTSTGAGIGKVPAILWAVDPSPESDDRGGSSSDFRVWQANLIDPNPDVL